MECIFAQVMNRALISIGTNTDKESNMAACRILLDEVFNNITYSETSVTEPYGSNYNSKFLNQLALIQTNTNKSDFEISIKLIETQLGRKAEDKKNGIVIIDIDLIEWNFEIVRPMEMDRIYIKNLLPTLPNYSSRRSSSSIR